MDPVSLLSKAPAYGKPVPACLYFTSIHYSRPKTENRNSVLSYAWNRMMMAGLRQKKGIQAYRKAWKRLIVVGTRQKWNPNLPQHSEHHNGGRT